MMWFYKLPRKVRVILAVVAWAPLLVLGYLIGDTVGANGENVQAWQAVLTVLFIAFAVVVDIFAVKARKRDSAQNNAVKSDNTTPPPEKSYTQYKPSVSTAGAGVKINKPHRITPALPVYPSTLKLSVFDNRVADLDLQAGDDAIVKFESDAVMRSSNGNAIIDANVYARGVKVGLLPYGKFIRTIYGKGDYACKIASVAEVDGKKTICVDIDLPFVVDSKLPLITKCVGVTFDNRQSNIGNASVGESLIIRHEPTSEYPNTIKVYIAATGACIGVMSCDIDEKLVKKYKPDCVFDGVITSIFGGDNGKSYGVEIVILRKQ